MKKDELAMKIEIDIIAGDFSVYDADLLMETVGEQEARRLRNIAWRELKNIKYAPLN